MHNIILRKKIMSPKLLESQYKLSEMKFMSNLPVSRLFILFI